MSDLLIMLCFYEYCHSCFKGLGTEARYDPTTEEFILNTPSKLIIIFLKTSNIFNSIALCVNTLHQTGNKYKFIRIGGKVRGRNNLPSHK